MSGSMQPQRFHHLPVPQQGTHTPQRSGSPSEASLHRWFFFAQPNQDSENTASGSSLPRSAKMARLEAVLVVADGPLSARRLTQFAMLSDVREAESLIQKLTVALDEARCSFRVERVATGYQLMTRPEFATWLDKLHQRQSHLKLSLPAMDTLAIVAYRQPVTRADVEIIRGVQSTEMLKQLMERGFVCITGHEESLGRPYLYGTTSKFLELFGLKNLDDMPSADRLRRVHTQQASDSDPGDAVSSDPNEEVEAKSVQRTNEETNEQTGDQATAA